MNYNSYKMTMELVKKILDYESIDSICVVDNNSNDNFENKFNDPKIHYIKNAKNLGYSAGNNVGLRYLIEEKCNILFVANPDTIFDNHVIEVMTQELIKNKDLALISTKRTGPNGGIIHQYFDFPTIKSAINSCFYITRRKFERNRHIIQNEIIDNAKGLVYVDAVPGSLFGISKKFLLENGYIYEGIFLYGEEIVLGRQAHELGYKVAIINSATYIHNHEQKKFSNLKMFKNDKNSLKKYFEIFKELNNIEKIALNLSIFLGTIEYTCAYYMYHLKNKICNYK